MPRLQYTKNQESQLKGGVQLDVCPGNGTRYDLTAMLDRNGGVIVCWPIMGWMYRYFWNGDNNASIIKQLGRAGCQNEYDLEAIHGIMDNWFKGVIQ